MSLQINHILVPTDFSEAAQNALPYALEIALKTGAKLTILHSIEEPYDFAPMIEEYREKMRNNVENIFHRKIDKILEQQRYHLINIKTSIVYGPAVFAMLDETKDLGIDLVVMGTTGATGLNRVLFGSNTTEIILRSEVPILAIPEKSPYKGVPHITFLTDYNDGDLNALENTVSFAQIFEAEISVLHITGKLTLREEIMHRGFKDIASKQIAYDKMKFELTAADELVEGVNEFFSLQPSSLVAMVKYKKPFFTKLLHKNHSKEMGFYTTLPLLVLPGEDPY